MMKQQRKQNKKSRTEDIRNIERDIKHKYD